MIVVSVCPLVTIVYCGRTAETMELPFGVVGGLGPRNHVLDRGPAPSRECANFWKETARSNVTYGRMRHRPYNISATRPFPDLFRISCFVACSEWND